MLFSASRGGGRQEAEEAEMAVVCANLSEFVPPAAQKLKTGTLPSKVTLTAF